MVTALTVAFPLSDCPAGNQTLVAVPFRSAGHTGQGGG